MKKVARQVSAILIVLLLTMSTITAQATSDVQISINANKKVDVALAVGTTSVDYSAFESQLREAIDDKIPERNLHIMATTSVDTSTSSNFEWLKFDHSLSNGGATDDFIDATGSQSDTVYDNLDRHVELDTTNGTKLTFKGYGSSAYSDFMLLENNQSTNKTFQFDIKEYFAADALYNIGFFFNSNLIFDTEKYSGNNAMYQAYQADELFLNGYLMTLEYNGRSTSGISIYKVKDLKLKSFHNDSNQQLMVGGNVQEIYELEAYIQRYLELAEKETDEAIKQNYLNRVQEAKEYLEQLKAHPTNFTKIASLPVSDTGIYKSTDDLRKFRVEVTPTTVTVYYAGFDDETHSVVDIENEADAQSFDLNSEGYKAFVNTSYDNLTALSFTLASDTSNSVTTIPLDSTFQSGGSDFGPMVKYGSHGCPRLTKVELSNLTMATDVVRSLNEVIREPQWDKDSSKFLVNLNEDPIVDFDNKEITGELLNRLQNDDIYYIGWGSNDNKVKSEEFLIKNDLKGEFVNIEDEATDTIEKQIKKIADAIVARYERESGIVSDVNVDVVTLGKKIVLDVTGAETTNTADDTYPQGKWTVKYYGTDGALISITTRSNLPTEYVSSGKYEIYYCGTQPENLIKTLVVNQPPKADFNVQIASGEAIVATLTNTSADLEGSPLTSKWTYSEVGSVSRPTELNQDLTQSTTLTMEAEKIYLVSLTVTDKWGASTTTSRQISYDENQTALPIADFSISVNRFVRNATGESITGSNIITVTDKSYDLYGRNITSTFSFTSGAAITMNPVSGQKGVYTIDTSALDAGTYSIYLTTNNGSNDSKRVAHTFKIIKDEAGPKAVANKKAGEITLPTTEIKVSFSDEGSGFLKQKVILSNSSTAPTKEEWAQVPYSYVETSKVPIANMEGTYYIHYQAIDTLGNVKTSYMGPYTVDTKAPSITIISPINEKKEEVVAPSIQFLVSEDAKKGNGYLYIRKASDDSVVYTIAASNKSVRLNEKTVTVNTMTSLENDTKYYISLSKGFLIDNVNNEMNAFDGKDKWTFTTKKDKDDIKNREIKIIGVDVSQLIDDGAGGTKKTETKAPVGINERQFTVNVKEDSNSDSTIHVTIKPNYSVIPGDKEVIVTVANGITYEKNKNGSYDIIIPRGTAANEKAVDITVKGETYTIKFVSYGSKWDNVTTQVVSNGIDANIPEMSLENAIDISGIENVSKNVEINVKFVVNANEAQLSANDLQTLRQNLQGNLKFVDLKVVKTVTIDSVVQEDEIIHNTLAPIKIRLSIPKEMQGNLNNLSVYRIHEGVISRLDSTIVNDGKEVEFESDAYSTYAIKNDNNGTAEAPIIKDTVNETPIIFEKINPENVRIPINKSKKVTAVTFN